MKQLQLSGDHIALVDSCRYDAVVAFGRWHLSTDGYVRTYVRGSGRKRKRYRYLHDLIAELCELPVTEVVDHRNQNKLDNRRCNLRPSTNTQNKRNHKLDLRNTTGYTGVSRITRSRKPKWLAQICCDGQRYRIGSFDSPEAAAKAYDSFAKRLFGKYASLNFRSHST